MFHVTDPKKKKKSPLSLTRFPTSRLNPKPKNVNRSLKAAVKASSRLADLEKYVICRKPGDQLIGKQLSYSWTSISLFNNYIVDWGG